MLKFIIPVALLATLLISKPSSSKSEDVYLYTATFPQMIVGMESIKTRVKTVVSESKCEEAALISGQSILATEIHTTMLKQGKKPGYKKRIAKINAINKSIGDIYVNCF